MKKLLLTFFFIFTIISLILLTYKIYSYKQTKLYSNLTSLHKIKEIDLNLNQNILKSKYLIIKNYDLFSQIIKDLDDELLEFESNSHKFFLESEPDELIERLSELISLKKVLIEKFKPNDSILKIGINDLTNKMFSLKNTEKNSFFEIDSIVQQIYLEQKSYEMNDLLGIIDKKRNSIKKQSVNQILNQVEIILLKQKEQTEIIESIISLPSEIVINRLINLSNQHIQLIQRNINIMRLIIGFLGIILVLVISTNLIQLKISEISLSSLNKNLFEQISFYEKFFQKNFLEVISENNLNQLNQKSLFKKEMMLIYLDLQTILESNKINKNEAVELANKFYKTSFSYIKKQGGLVEKYNLDSIEIFLEPNSDKYLDIVLEIQDFFLKELKLHNELKILIYIDEFEFVKLGENSNFNFTFSYPKRNFIQKVYKLNEIYSVPIFTNQLSLKNLKSNKEIEFRKLDSLKIDETEIEIFELITKKDKGFLKKMELKTYYKNGLELIEKVESSQSKKNFPKSKKNISVETPTKLKLKKTSIRNS